MRVHFFGVVVALATCAMVAKIGSTPVQEPGPTPLTARFELQLYKQGNLMDHPQDSPPSLSIEYKSIDKAATASVVLKVEHQQHRQDLRVEGRLGKGDYKHFWGQELAGQPSRHPGKTEWWRHSLMTYSDLDRFAGTYELTADGKQSVIKLGPAQSTGLQPTSIPPVKAEPADGFTVRWTPVIGAIGYQVCVRQGTYPDYLEWNNSGEDWLSIGSEEALARGVLLKDTLCRVPAGIFAGRVYVDVKAVSPEVRGEGEIPSVAWSESNMSIEVGEES